MPTPDPAGLTLTHGYIQLNHGIPSLPGHGHEIESEIQLPTHDIKILCECSPKEAGSSSATTPAVGSLKTCGARGTKLGHLEAMLPPSRTAC